MASVCTSIFMFCCVYLISIVHAQDDKSESSTSIQRDGSSSAGSDEIFFCRQCGAILFRGKKYLPGSMEHAELIGRIDEERLGGTGGSLLVFEQPAPAKEQHTVATFRNAEPNSIEVANTLFGKNEDSYFPGYTWRPARCSSCKAHIGWAFQDKDTDKVSGKRRSSEKVQASYDMPTAEPTVKQQKRKQPSTKRSKLSSRSVHYSAAQERKVLQVLQGVCLVLP